MAKRDAPTRRVIDVEDGPKAMIDIDPDMVDFIIVRAREFDVKVPPAEAEPGSNPSDDKGVEIIEDDPDDMTQTELRDAIESLSDDAAHDLLAMFWIGRGDYTADEWNEARGQAIERGRGAEGGLAKYLMGEPNLGDFLEEGLSELGYFSTSDEVERKPSEDEEG